MVTSALASGSSSTGPSAVFLGKTLYSHSASLHLGVHSNGYRQN